MLKYFLFLILFLDFFGELKSEPCFCFANQTVTASIKSISLGPPTITGGFGSTSCATNCSTTITFEGDVNDGLPSGEKITILLCQNLNKANILKVYAGEKLIQMLDSCPTTSPYTFTISHSHVYTFMWQLSTPVSAIIVTQPIEVVPSTTPSIKTTTTIFGYSSVQADVVLIIDGSDTVNSTQNNVIQNALLNAFEHFTIDSEHINMAIITALGDQFPIALLKKPFTSIYNDDGLQKALNFAYDNNIFYSSTGQGSLSFATKQLYNPDFLNYGYRNSTKNHLAIYVTTTSTPYMDAITEAQNVLQKHLFQFLAIGYQGGSNLQSLTELVGGNSNCVIITSDENEITKFLISKLWIAANNGGQYC